VLVVLLRARDWERGFLRELRIAPVSPASLLSKCLGGAIHRASQGLLLLALAGLVGVPYDPGLLLGVLAIWRLTRTA
jgi:ABC-2 type transport system permease protein